LLILATVKKWLYLLSLMMFLVVSSTAGANDFYGVRVVVAAKASTTIIPRTVGAASKGFSKVLQTGGHTLNNSTLKALGLTKGQGKIAIEALKQDLRLPANFHGKIMGNGDLVHPHTNQVLGNLFDYLN